MWWTSKDKSLKHYFTKGRFTGFLFMGALVTIIFVTMHVLVQQSLRSSANDPQIQIAEDVASYVEQGVPPQNIISPQPRDLNHSLAPFVAVYDNQQKLLATDGNIDGKDITIPSGVLQAAKKGHNIVTWQPKLGLRFALVAVPYGGSHPGVIVAGRSLREVEKRESFATAAASGAWLLSILVGTAAAFLLL